MAPRERDFGEDKSRNHAAHRTPISSVSLADAEGTVASSSKINEPFRRPWDVERARYENGAFRA